MNRKNVIKLTAFLLVFLLLFSAVNVVFNPGDEIRNEKASFYEEPENSMEVIFCGSSSMLRDVSPMELYKDYGITSYSMATVLQAPAVTEFTVKEALRYQKPKVVVINMESAAVEYNHVEREAHIHSSLDPFRFSLDKLEAIMAIRNYDPNQQVLDYLFPVVRYHGAWTEMLDGFEKLEHQESYQKGYVGMKTSVEVTPAENYMSYSGEAVELRDDAMQYYRGAVQACLDQNIPVLLVKLPRMTWTMEEHEALADFASEMGIDYLDFNQEALWQETGIDTAKDFYDANHLNHTGAVKLTEVLGKYLVENYELTDASGYEAWDAVISDYEAEYAHCLHETITEEGVHYSVSSAKETKDLSYRWDFYKNNELAVSEETAVPDMDFVVEEATEYYVICTVTDSDGTETIIQSDKHIYQM